jgi:hypothetical protein
VYSDKKVDNNQENGKEGADATSQELQRTSNWRNTMIRFLLWLLLLAFCWPLALLALILYPVVWILTIPFRLVGITVDALFATLKAMLFLPARILGAR